jgi:DNA segregation ATPase FtsK/SpoIIIE, S-DNA-T family
MSLTQINGHTRDLLPEQREPEDDIPPQYRHALPDQVAEQPPDQPLTAPASAGRRRLHAVRAAAGHPATRAAARQGAYVLVGAHQTARKRHQARTLHTRMIRAAEAVGDHAAVAEWAERHARHRQERHARRMAILTAPAHVAKALVIGSGITLAGLIVLGFVLGLSEHSIHEVISPLMTAVDSVRWCVHLLELLYGPVLMTLPFAILGALWNAGRQHGTAPTWLMPPRLVDTTGAPITPSIVVTALRDLGITTLKTAIKAMGDAGAGMLGPIRIAGCGVEVDVTLPSGVSTEEVQAKRRKLAENLDRHEHEVFLTIPQAARTVRLWIADSGALDEPIGPSPLVTDMTGTADLYTGRAPWGQDLRGDAALMSLHQRHLLITGLSNQGKTASLRALALWAALDPTVEFRLGDLKGVGDWRMFIDLASVYIAGPTDDHAMQVTHMLEDAATEMDRRTVALEKSGATDGVTRDMARSGKGFHPIIVLVDEAQVAFMCPAKGEDGRPYGGKQNTSRYFMAARRIHNQGRAVNVVLWQGTQDPTDQNLPKLVREGAHIRASLVLGSEAQARMALGDKAVNGGAAPHKLRQGIDKGTVVVAGDGVALPPGQPSLTIRTHFISGTDAATIADVAKRRRKKLVTSTPTDHPIERDLLADVLSVLGDQRRMLTMDAIAGLKHLDDTAYQALTPATFKARLSALGVETHKTDGGKIHVRADWVQTAINDRTQDQTDRSDD